MTTQAEAAAELLARRMARTDLGEYLSYVNPAYKHSAFSRSVCASLERFIAQVQAGERPVLILQAPPQHGKSEIVSRKLPAYLFGRFPNMRLAGSSYSDELANSMAQDVRRTIAGDAHLRLFPAPAKRDRFALSRAGEFTNPNGTGSYLGVGIGAGLTGRPYDIGIIDDPVKNAKEALSSTSKETNWNWYQTVFKTRASECSGQIVMATSWAEDDLAGRIISDMAGDPRLTVLRFPAINAEGEAGYDPDLPLGPLVPQLHSLAQLLEIQRGMSEYWWAAMYQQSPRAAGGNVFKADGVRYYLPKDLPEKFDKVVASWDATFKDTDGSDFVVGQVWGRKVPSAYLLGQKRERMSFTKTVTAVVEMREQFPMIRATLIEDKANGPAVIDTLKPKVPGLIPIEPDGSKLARAHAMTYLWEAGNLYLPHPDIAPWVKDLVSELLSFPAAAHDDQVDALTQGTRYLFPLHNKLKITRAALERASGYTRR